tara:strand:+ start:6949 stop:8049 length:1101 start_codon:yes stop_codon:yes gene_type:complete
MSIHRLKLVSVRNHDKSEFIFGPGVTVIWGQNGSGKTTVLESINTLSLGNSFKTNKQKELISAGHKEAFIFGEFKSSNYQDSIAANISSQKGQQIKLNGKKITGRKALLGRNPTVVLSPEEQGLTQGPPSQRRKFFNKVFSVISKEYFQLLQNYNKIKKQRSFAIAQHKGNETANNSLDLWNVQLATSGAGLWKARADLMCAFNSKLEKVSQMFGSSFKVAIMYNPVLSCAEEYLLELEKSFKRDLVLGRTSFGPHCDEMVINIFGKNIKMFGSQGEHKLALIILKLTELFFIKKHTGITPILLLDDLFSKLDLDRSKQIVELLKKLEEDYEKPIQTVLTTTDVLDIQNTTFKVPIEKRYTYHLLR